MSLFLFKKEMMSAEFLNAVFLNNRDSDPSRAPSRRGKAYGTDESIHLVQVGQTVCMIDQILHCSV